MAALFSNLPKSQTRQILSDLNYLNLKELRELCDKYSIPYRIRIETENGESRTTRENDRKKIVLERVGHFLKTGSILPPTVFPKSVIRESKLPKNLTPKTQIFYGCYDKTNEEFIALLRKLTDGEFRNGAVARILLRDHFAQGIAPSIEEFAIAWRVAQKNYSLSDHPEAAYLTDISKGTVGGDWKAKRGQKSKDVFDRLAKIVGKGYR